eukprot:1702276-Amphidinium_carterae.1
MDKLEQQPLNVNKLIIKSRFGCRKLCSRLPIAPNARSPTKRSSRAHCAHAARFQRVNGCSE